MVELILTPCLGNLGSATNFWLLDKIKSNKTITGITFEYFCLFPKISYKNVLTRVRVTLICLQVYFVILSLCSGRNISIYILKMWAPVIRTINQTDA